MDYKSKILFIFFSKVINQYLSVRGNCKSADQLSRFVLDNQGIDHFVKGKKWKIW